MVGSRELSIVGSLTSWSPPVLVYPCVYFLLSTSTCPIISHLKFVSYPLLCVCFSLHLLSVWCVCCQMLRVWEDGHLTPGWSFSHVLGSRIYHLLRTCPGPTNMVHFARLFQSQLLAMCRGDDDQCHLNQDQEGKLLTLLYIAW